MKMREIPKKGNPSEYDKDMELHNIFTNLNPNYVALKITGIYLVFGFLWIFLSDTILTSIAPSIEFLSYISIIKGLVFVTICGILIHRLVYNSIKKLKRIESFLSESYSKLQKANEESTEAKNFYATILNKMLNAYALHKIILDEDGNPCDYEYVDVNAAFEEFTGIKATDIIGKRYTEVIPKNQSEKTNWIEIYGAVAIKGESLSFEEYTSAFDRWVLVNTYSPRKRYFITVFSDITVIKKKEKELEIKNQEITSLYEQLLASEEELRQQFDELYNTKEELKNQHDELEIYQRKIEHNAYHDLLTGLPNRLFLFEKVAQMKSQQRFAILFIDSDNFKLINDTMGHSFGDQLLIEIGNRLTSILHPSCSVYRLGGDEFVICYRGFEQVKEVTEYADEIIQSFRKPFKIGESMYHTTVSIGIALCPEHGKDMDELLQSADIALFEAKRSGKNKYVIFHELMRNQILERTTIEKHLRDALDKNEFVLYYQPQLDICNNKITGYEALLRWNSAELGFIPPLKFISIAEETQLIIPIGKWVLKEACRFIKELHNKGNSDVIVAVNISIIQILDENFVPSVLSILKESDLAPEFLELEITESILMESYNEVIKKLGLLKNAGVRIALDDFGKGYSSLSRLKQLPLDTLKIDKSFIDCIPSNLPGANLAGQIMVLGRNLGLTILAEGVEEEKQMNYLRRHECQKVQGYLISKPLPHAEAILFHSVYKDKALI